MLGEQQKMEIAEGCTDVDGESRKQGRLKITKELKRGSKRRSQEERIYKNNKKIQFQAHGKQKKGTYDFNLNVLLYK